jgi:hypothetical protein
LTILTDSRALESVARGQRGGRDAEEGGMRDSVAPLLTFWVVAVIGACVPAAPRLDSPPAPDTGVADREPVSRDVVPTEPPAARPEAAPPVRVDAAVAERPREAGSEASPRQDGATDGRSDAAPGDAVATEVRVGRAPRAGELVIDEVLVDPAGNDLGHEWLEIANVTDEALDLTALHVADDATEVAVAGGVLEPRALLVLGQSADRDHNGGAPVDFAYGTRLAFNNGGDRLTLCAGPCAAGVVLATFAWTAAFGADYAGRAVVVTSAGTTCPATVPYGDGGVDFGTPGRPNGPCAPTSDAGDAGDAGDR